jgi:hypothetical protein
VNNNFNIYILISYPVTISGSISSNIIGYHEQNNPIKKKTQYKHFFYYITRHPNYSCFFLKKDMDSMSSINLVFDD